MSSKGAEFVVVRVRDGEVAADGNWVYTAIGAHGRVLYVGATDLEPATRMWLHLADRDLEGAELDVLAMRVPEEISRTDVRDVLGARLADEGLLADDAITDQLQLVLDPPPEAVEVAERYLARLRSYLEQRTSVVAPGR